VREKGTAALSRLCTVRGRRNGRETVNRTANRYGHAVGSGWAAPGRRGRGVGLASGRCGPNTPSPLIFFYLERVFLFTVFAN
jgi:hypothetical protein